MAERSKEIPHGKEKVGGSHSPGMDAPQRRRTPKSSLSGSPERDSSILSEKPIPNYLKPTKSFSSAREGLKHGQKQAFETHSPKRLVRKLSFDRNHSTTQLQKASLSTCNKDKLARASPPSKVISDKTPKTSKSGNAPSSAKHKILNKVPSFTKTTECKTPPQAVVISCNTTEDLTSPLDQRKRRETTNEEVQSAVDGDEEEFSEKSSSLDQAPEQPKGFEATAVGVDGSENNDNVCEFEEFNGDSEMETEDRKKNFTDMDNLHEPYGHGCTKEEDGLEDDFQLSEETQIHEIQQANQEPHEHSEYGNKIVDTAVSPESTRPSEMDNSDKSLEASEDNNRDIHHEEEGNKGIRVKEDLNEGVEDNIDENKDIQEISLKESENVEHMEKKAESEGPELKKHEVKAKKDSLAYNDVIEETASKLVEKRKNRVLALAGAFETVISLHESNAQSSKGRD